LGRGPAKAESPLARGAGGLGFETFDGRSVQAMAVRRHVHRVVMVMTMMAMDLHLEMRLRNPFRFVKHKLGNFVV
jgi:hypothetical protein